LSNIWTFLKQTPNSQIKRKWCSNRLPWFRRRRAPFCNRNSVATVKKKPTQSSLRNLLFLKKPTSTSFIKAI